MIWEEAQNIQSSKSWKDCHIITNPSISQSTHERMTSEHKRADSPCQQGHPSSNIVCWILITAATHVPFELRPICDLVALLIKVLGRLRKTSRRPSLTILGFVPVECLFPGAAEQFVCLVERLFDWICSVCLLWCHQDGAEKTELYRCWTHFKLSIKWFAFFFLENLIIKFDPELIAYIGFWTECLN